MSKLLDSLTSMRGTIERRLKGLRTQEKLASQLIGDLKDCNEDSDMIMSFTARTGFPIAGPDGAMTNQLELLLYPDELPAIIPILEQIRDKRAMERDCFESNYDSLLEKADALDSITGEIHSANKLN